MITEGDIPKIILAGIRTEIKKKMNKKNKTIEKIESGDKDCKKEEWMGWKIVEEMLNHPDECGIYPTSECYRKLYEFVCKQKDKQKEKIKKEQYSWLSPHKPNGAMGKIIKEFLDDFYSYI